MNYVEVAVADMSYRGQEPLTYQFETPLENGAIVNVPVRGKQVLGIVTSSVPKPSFSLKSVMEHAELPPLPKQLIELSFWMKDYYASSIGVTTQQFLPKKLAKPNPPEILEKPKFDSLPPLTQDQSNALGLFSSSGMHLLHGDTGTGKTRVYIELANRSLLEGRSSIILTPEIGLTSQLARDFQNVFGNGRVFIIHSKLTETVRQKTWTAMLEQKNPIIVIGPRSALFSPLSNVGLIVVDEAHETAYKQDQAPYYHATRVASKLADLHKATIVLGSATPLVADYFMAEQKKCPIIRLTQTATGKNADTRNLEVVDLRDHSKFTRKPFISDLLIDSVAQTLSRKEQVLLFLNRRGTARIVICNNCGWKALCPKCDLALVYHGDIHRMLCHTCSFSTQLPNSCPECHNAEIILKSIGTKAIADDITNLFPEAKIMRFDNDNKKTERIEQHYEEIHSGKVDILIGTQTLAKGLDLPKLSLVGVIIADTSLYFPDFSAGERTYQLLSQVLGRVNRGHRESKAIIQTYATDSPVMSAVLQNEWSNFYNKELKERSQFLFPPFCHLLKLSCRRATPKSAQQAAEKFAEMLLEMKLRIIIEGPSPCFHEKVNNKYQWQLVIKSKNRAELLKVVSHLPSGWSYDIDPMNLL